MVACCHVSLRRKEALPSTGDIKEKKLFSCHLCDSRAFVIEDAFWPTSRCCENWEPEQTPPSGFATWDGWP
jgi:hypothetical protein